MAITGFSKKMAIPALVIIISACGGGGSSPNNPNIVVPPTDDGVIGTNEAVDLVLHLPEQTISNISWQQLSGPQTNFLASNSKVIAFTTPSAGQYQFSVSYDVQGQARQSKEYTLNVNSEQSRVNARLGHAVIEGNKVSLRSHIDTSLSQNNIRWMQTAGPSVTFLSADNSSNGAVNNDGESVIYFNAPEVEQDTLLTFELRLSQNGIDHVDSVSVLVEDAPDIAANAYSQDPLARVFPANSDSPYADTLANCVYSNSLTSSCTFASLPLIAHDTSSPTTEDIMDRVLVSHPWMADRFRDFLNNYDSNNDFKNLLRATTAVVISYDIRPSFYWASTGAIYLDGKNFWLTPDERDTLNEALDYRSSFGNELQFVMPWRYVKNNDYASDYISADARVSRSQDDYLYDLSRLLYHELAHANDFFPSTEWHAHSSNTRVLDAALATNFESDQLAIAYPLTSEEMRNLAQVSFQGNDASDTQKGYLPTDIRQFFSLDSASDYYSYSSLREDYAMLFEELMMQNRYGVSRDVAITNRPTGDNVFAQDYIVSWGERGRIATASVKPRVLFTANRVLPEFDAASALETLPAVIAMNEGENWIENLSISPSVQAKSRTNTKNATAENSDESQQRPVQWLRPHHQAFPQGHQ
ncbi:hypothetical protein [Thalassotalea sp. PLHSN55]|uniref:hypothetical protein n=1 Tax=Thalassotalea sp. PLHSN55 TaxID=3435888 RepID=UPI003F8512D0